MDNEKVGKYIQNRRKQLNMTQAELADKLFLTRMCVSKWEYGYGLPSTDTLISLSKILGVTVQEILMGEYISKNELVEKSEESIEVVFRYTKKQIQKIKTQSIFLIIIFILIQSITTLILNHPYYKNPEIYIDREMSIWDEELPNHTAYETIKNEENVVVFKNPERASKKASGDYSDVIEYLKNEYNLPAYNEKNFMVYIEYIDMINTDIYLLKKQAIDFKYFLNIYEESLIQNN